MRRSIGLLMLACLGCDSPAQVDLDSALPRHPAAVTCFIGRVDSGRRCSSRIDTCPPAVADVTATFKLGCGDAGGPLSEIEWQFLGQRGESDLYRLIRRFPVDDSASETTVREVAYGGKRVIVFEDDVHCVVIEPPVN